MTKNESINASVTFRVYGRDGHRQRVSFAPSNTWNWSTDDDTRIIHIANADETGTNAYTELTITRNTVREVCDELDGQLSDGIFEDSHTGRITVIENGIERDVEWVNGICIIPATND